MRNDLFRLGVLEAARRIREGTLTSEAYTRALLERIAEGDGGVEAWAFLDPELALERARGADRESRPGRPLAGIPVGMKDIIATRDMPTGMGSPVFAGRRPGDNARVVERLEAAGAFTLGKTVTTELAFMHPGKTRNPWNPAHTPGGSSSGSAAAVAAGFVPAAVGTQTNGSVIRPAAYCGVVGYKPGRTLMSMEGIQPFSRTLDQAGVFTRGVADAAAFAAALSLYPGSVAAEPLEPARPPRLALLLELPWADPDPGQARALERWGEVFARDGAQVTPWRLPPEFSAADRVHRVIMLYEAARELGPLQERERGRLSAVLNDALDEGRRIGEEDYRKAVSERHLRMFHLASLIQEFDAVLSPPAPGAAPPGLARTGNPAFCTLWSLAGFPALTLPAELTPEGLPLGLQLTAPSGVDSLLLGTAHWCEQRLGFRQLVSRER
jgi:Asp-tRNA(Asn)/Glu-tRNA(Gln) amidotransferase A subunit family amidase